jgi:peptidylprolyl isomerase/FKBP-type peptidyl-prolyl cis-trans isomerase FklB
MRHALTAFSLLIAAASPALAAPAKKAAAPARKPTAAAPRAPAAPKLPVGKILLPPLSYTIEKSGPATGAHPDRNDLVTVNYKLTLLDGKVIDSTDGKGPATFPLNRLIPAWQVMLQLMRPGDAWMLYVPSEYAYGPMARDELPANAFLTFRVELLSIGEPKPAVALPQEQ